MCVQGSRVASRVPRVGGVCSIGMLGMFCCNQRRVNSFSSVVIEFSVNFHLLNQSFKYVGV